ncbi:MAG: AsmA-like C-terminal region-containing protein, partial [Methyloceanibacter sp.]
PPSAANIPLALTTDVVKQGDSLAFAPIKATIDGDTIEGSAKFHLGEKTRFTLQASAGTVSLPSLLGVLVAWQRTPSTEETLGAIGADVSEVWPSRGFSLGVFEKSEGEITLQAKTLSLGAPFQIADATLVAHVGEARLSVTDIQGRLFGGAFTASGVLAPRGAGATFEAKAKLVGGKLEAFSKGIAGKGLAKGPFDLALTVQGEGLSPPGLVASLNGEGTLSLGAGTLQSLSPEPLRRVAASAAKKSKTSQAQIAAEAQAVREKVTKGLYKYAPVELPFEVKNGTLRFRPVTLAGAGAETKVNAFVELASLKLDSEWEMSLAGAKNRDVPPVNLVFTGSLIEAGDIAPAIDTAAIEAYLTLRRLQEGVERLETLDVSGRTPALPAEAEPVEETPAPETTQMPVPTPKPIKPAALPETVPLPMVEPEQAMPTSETAITEDQVTPETAEVPSEMPVTRTPRRMPRPAREAPDDWKKGVGIFGG